MLPTELLSLVTREERVTPRYLTEADAPWVQSMVDVASRFVGRTAGERDRALLPRVRSIAWERGAPLPAAEGVAYVLERAYGSRVVSAVPPERVRAVVFEESARDAALDRNAVLARAAARLAVDADEVERSLFADRASARIVLPPEAPLAAGAVIEAYNVALVQGLLARSESVRVDVREHVDAIVRFAKHAGLLCTASVTDDGISLDVSGPLTVLRSTAKYGHALARFYPTILATRGFRLTLRCVLGRERPTVTIEDDPSVAQRRSLPREGRPALLTDVKRLGRGWTARRGEGVRLGVQVFVPDFELVRGDDCVRVEVIRFWTDELGAKLEALRAAHVGHLVVCLDRTVDCDERELPFPVLRIGRRIDAIALLDLVEALVRGHSERVSE